jgi:hypothetical protein
MRIRESGSALKCHGSSTLFLRPSLIDAYLIVVFGYFANVVEGVLAAMHPGRIKYAVSVAGTGYQE